MDTNIERLRNNDERVFKEIVQSYWPRMHKFALTYVMDEEAAKEIVQDTFLALWEHRKELEGDTCLISYLMVINRNKCYNYLKSLHLETVEINELTENAIYQRSHLYVLEDDSLELLVTHELHAALEVSLEKLPSKTKEIFLASRYDGLKNREIATQQQMTLKAVEFHITKALKHLRTDLSEEYFLLFLVTLIGRV